MDFGWLGDVIDGFAGLLNGALSWILDTVQDVHPVVRSSR